MEDQTELLLDQTKEHLAQQQELEAAAEEEEIILQKAEVAEMEDQVL